MKTDIEQQVTDDLGRRMTDVRTTGTDLDRIRRRSRHRTATRGGGLVIVALLAGVVGWQLTAGDEQAGERVVADDPPTPTVTVTREDPVESNEDPVVEEGGWEFRDTGEDGVLAVLEGRSLPEIRPPVPEADIAVRVVVYGSGMVEPTHPIKERTPILQIQTDGTAYRRVEPPPGEYGSAVYWGVERRTVDPDALKELVSRALDDDLVRENLVSDPQLSEQPTTWIDLAWSERSDRTERYGLWYRVENPDAEPTPSADLIALGDWFEELGDLPGTAWEPYRPERVGLVLSETYGEALGHAAEWPSAWEPSLSSALRGVSPCYEVTGVALDELWSAVADPSNEAFVLPSSGEVIDAGAWAMLPGDQGCGTHPQPDESPGIVVISPDGNAAMSLVEDVADPNHSRLEPLLWWQVPDDSAVSEPLVVHAGADVPFPLSEQTLARIAEATGVSEVRPPGPEHERWADLLEAGHALVLLPTGDQDGEG